MANAPHRETTHDAQELTDLYRRLNRLHSALNLSRPANKMTESGRAAAAMIGTATDAVVDAITLWEIAEANRRVPTGYLNMVAHRAVVVAHECIEQIGELR